MLRRGEGPSRAFGFGREGILARLAASFHNFSCAKMMGNFTNAMTGLFKYFPPDKLEFFEKSLVLLTPPKYLNDPWDFFPQGRTATDEEIFREWQKLESEIEQSSLIKVPFDFAQRQRQNRLQQMLRSGKSKEFVEGLPKYSQEYVSSRYGIVSFTEKPLCRLMWAHYAASHSGFVAEFSVVGPPTKTKDNLICCGCMDYPICKVEYPPDFKPRPWDRDTIVGATWSKHPHWKYEKEWRMLFPLNYRSVCWRKERYCLPFLPERLNRVIFGMRMKPEDRQRLRHMLEKNEFERVRKEVADIDNETGELILKPIA